MKSDLYNSSRASESDNSDGSDISDSSDRSDSSDSIDSIDNIDSSDSSDSDTEVIKIFFQCYEKRIGLANKLVTKTQKSCVKTQNLRKFKKTNCDTTKISNCNQTQRGRLEISY